jgi:isoamylase
MTDGYLTVIVPRSITPPTGRSPVPRKTETKQPVTRGSSTPLGATCHADGVNFCVYSPSAIGLDLLLFDHPNNPLPASTISLDSSTNRTANYWHVFIPGLDHGQIYAWRARGPRQLEKGLRFDGDKVLLDPYGRATTGWDIYDRSAARAQGENTAHALRSVVVDNGRYDWEGDQPLPQAAGREIIYEMHVSGFTKSPSSGLPVPLRGTYAGFVEKIPYLKKLGITAVELLPVHQYDPQDAPAGFTNFWGYSSVGFFAPHHSYSSDQSPCGPVDEFRDMVKALHRAGIRIILDVVYNHTTEAGTDGPLISWRGLSNKDYYLLDETQTGFADFTGCGNTLNANGSVAARMIIDSLHYWVQEMHVDGFRFDLASAMTRGTDGKPMANPPLIEAINSDPVLAGTTLIAEAWDAAGLYQVGSFPGDRFAEWNGPFRDHARAFWRGDQGTIENLMGRIVGSPDLMSAEDEVPSHSINFVTCHDGFCLNDLVSYDKKHNLENGEENRDGSNHNLSFNHGIEGATNDAAINALRLRQIRNFLVLLFLSHGTPMLLMGDEIRQTRLGNNNPWNQDNERNWLDWDLVRENADLLRFVRQLIGFSSELDILKEDRFWFATTEEKSGDITWHGLKPNRPDWTASSQCIGYSLKSRDEVLVLLNASDTKQVFTLPKSLSNLRWYQMIDTSEAAPNDIKDLPEAQTVTGKKVFLGPKSSLVLITKASNV